MAKTKEPRKGLKAKLVETHPVPDNTTLVWLAPREERNDILHRWYWRSQCGRYEISRVSNAYGLGTRFVLYYLTGDVDWQGRDVWHPATKEGRLNEPREFRDLDAAMDAGLNLHCLRTKTNAGSPNQDDLVVAARKADGLHQLPRIAVPLQAPTADGTSPVRATRASGPVDKWGAKEGSEKAKLHAAIDATPKNMKELVAAGGLKDTMYNHCKALLEQGLIARDDTGRYYDPKATKPEPEPKRKKCKS